MDELTTTPIGYLRTALRSKFAVPRQSGVVPSLTGVIELVPAFRQPEALRGLEGFSHIWVIWVFSEAMRQGWSATVRPPRLGGNEHLGVFATRSPFRPNPIGLSCVELTHVDAASGRITVAGVDLMDGTPILDIKPYVPYTDAHPQAKAGFAPAPPAASLAVEMPDAIAAQLGEDAETVCQLIALDPRPAYQRVDDRTYGFPFGEFDVRFRVDGDRATIVELTVLEPKGR